MAEMKVPGKSPVEVRRERYKAAVEQLRNYQWQDFQKGPDNEEVKQMKRALEKDGIFPDSLANPYKKGVAKEIPLSLMKGQENLPAATEQQDRSTMTKMIQAIKDGKVISGGPPSYTPTGLHARLRATEPPSQNVEEAPGVFVNWRPKESRGIPTRDAATIAERARVKEFDVFAHEVEDMLTFQEASMLHLKQKLARINKTLREVSPTGGLNRGQPFLSIEVNDEGVGIGTGQEGETSRRRSSWSSDGQDVPPPDQIRRTMNKTSDGDYRRVAAKINREPRRAVESRPGLYDIAPKPGSFRDRISKTEAPSTNIEEKTFPGINFYHKGSKPGTTSQEEEYALKWRDESDHEARLLQRLKDEMAEMDNRERQRRIERAITRQLHHGVVKRAAKRR